MDPRPPSPPRSPRKRLRMDDGAAIDVMNMSEDRPKSPETGAMDPSKKQDSQNELHKESEVGILHHVSSDVAGFEGLLKKRYTDFLVNEVQTNGTVLHLDSLKVPHAPGAKATKPARETDESNERSMEVTEGHSTDERSVVKPEDATAATDQEAHPTETESGEGSNEPNSNKDGAAAWRNYAEQHKGFVVSLPHAGMDVKADLHKLSTEDRQTLESFLGVAETDEALALFNRILESPHRKPIQYGTVRSEKTIDRASRTNLHEAIRRIFASRLESHTESNGTFVIAAASGRAFAGAQNKGSRNRNNQGRDNAPRLSTKQKFAALGGDYLHFSLYKENKDTLEVTAFMARSLQLQPKTFQFAGTKDRRAITVQRVSAYRVMAPAAVKLNQRLRNAKIGNFSYEQKGLTLGELSGNEFVITLRECSFPGTENLPLEERNSVADSIVRNAMQHLMNSGFINYYGMQRFGTFYMRTDTIGTALLRGDYESAVNLLLHFNLDILKVAKNESQDPLYSYDDKARALGIKIFQDTGNADAALEKLPRKFSGEANVIRFLGRKGAKTDFLNAILSIPRALRLMYVHAYQSLIWNHAASHRWATGGAKVLEGDLVLVNEHKDKEAAGAPVDVVDADGEPVVQPGQNDRALTEEERFERARALTKDEAESGSYSIFDVVLPSPGYDVLYPAYMVRFYEELMAKDDFGGLDPHNMRRNVRDLSLSGHYRKLLARPQGPYDCRVVAYAEENEQFVQTDADRLDEAQKLAYAKIQAQRKLKVSGDASVQEEEEEKMDYSMGMDGAIVSKARAIKDSVFGSGSNGQNPKSDGEATAPATEQSSVAEENDAMDTTPVEEQPDTAEVSQPIKDKLAVILTLQLGTSTYATMALRELSKGGIRAYKPEFGGGRV